MENKKTVDLEAKAKETFEYHKQENEVFVTADGAVFLKKAKNYAQDHARRNNLELVTFSREDVYSSKKSKGSPVSLNDMTIPEIKELASKSDIELHSRKKADLIKELEEKQKEQADSEPKKHTVTKEDLENNPSLKEEGVEVGDEISIEMLESETETSEKDEKDSESDDSEDDKE